MKQILITSILFFLSANLFGQTIQEIENELQQAYKRILSDRFDADTIAWDNLENDNRLFREKMLRYTSNYPLTLTYNFDSLTKAIYIVTSDDNLLRIYSWDTRLGGTMHDFENIYQFKSVNNIDVNVKCNTALDGKENYVPYYSQLFTLKEKDRTYYLAINNGIYSTKDISQSIKAFTIENNTLNDTIKIFKTKTELLNEISINLDFFSVVDRPERPLQLINYDSDKKIIYIPIVYENGEVTDRYILYQFNGQYFEHIMTQKN